LSPVTLSLSKGGLKGFDKLSLTGVSFLINKYELYNKAGSFLYTELCKPDFVTLIRSYERSC